MNDRLRQLETELAAMRPRSVPAEVAQRIDDAVAAIGPGRWADRCLIWAMGAGTLAASVIVFVIISGSGAVTSPSPRSGFVGDVSQLGSLPRAIAGADLAALDSSK